MATTDKPTRRRRSMSPQPAAPPVEKPVEKPAEDADAQEFLALIEAATAGDREGAAVILRAIQLEAEKAATFVKIQKNRTFLRGMDDNELLNDEQQEFLDTWYSEKKRGDRRSEDDIEASRKLRATALQWLSQNGKGE